MCCQISISFSCLVLDITPKPHCSEVQRMEKRIRTIISKKRKRKRRKMIRKCMFSFALKEHKVLFN